MSAMLARTAAVLSAAALGITGSASASTAQTTLGVVHVPCSAAALAAAIAGAGHGEVLSLTPLCAYQLTASLPPISTNLTIRGNRATVERSLAPGTPDFTMLDVGFRWHVSISDLSFRRAAADQPAAAGAILNEGELTVTGSSFVGNTTTGYGGAIENDGTLTVNSSTFSGNLSADGGAIENLSVAYIADSSFRDNQATFNGGAFHNEGQSTFRDIEFAGNSAASVGGGIFNGIEGNAATITGSIFRSNQAAAGGGIYNEDVVKLTGAIVVGNGSAGQGGGIFSDWVLAVTNSLISRNTAAAGGGIYNGDFFGPPGSVTLTGSLVLRNSPDNCEPANSIASCNDPAPTTSQTPRAVHAGRARSGIQLARALARDFHPTPTADGRLAKLSRDDRPGPANRPVQQAGGSG